MFAVTHFYSIPPENVSVIFYQDLILVSLKCDHQVEVGSPIDQVFPVGDGWEKNLVDLGDFVY